MKYAIPVSGNQLMSHFGMATEFMLLDVDQDGRVAMKETINVVPHSCGTLPGELARRGVGVVLAGGMGMGPRMAFNQSNIEVVLGVTEIDPEKQPRPMLTILFRVVITSASTATRFAIIITR